MAALSFLTSAVNVIAANVTHTFSTQSLGDAASDRYIIVNVSTSDAGAGITVSGITVGGVSSDILVQDSIAASTRLSGIAIALVPTGTTGDVVVTFSAPIVRSGIGLYRATGINPTPFHFNSNDAASGASLATTINTTDGGILVASFLNNTASIASTSWTNATENYDELLAGNHLHSGAYVTSTSAATGTTITATPNTSIGVGAALCVASFENGSDIKKVSGIARASIKKISGVAIANVKKITGIA